MILSFLIWKEFWEYDIIINDGLNLSGKFVRKDNSIMQVMLALDRLHNILYNQCVILQMKH